MPTPPPSAASAEASIHLNEARLPWTEELTVATLLQAHGLRPDQVATALNGEFVARAQREHLRLRPGDRLTTFSPIVGG